MRALSRLLRGMRARLRQQTGWRAGLILFLAGAVSVLGFAPWHIQPAYGLGLVILILMLDDARRARRALRAGLWRGWAFGAGLFLAGTWWVANAFVERGEGYREWAFIPLLAMPIGLGLFWALAGLAYVRFWQSGPSRLVVFTAAFTGAEMLRATILSGFPWNLPGHIWPAGGAISQIASLIGASGLSALTLFVLAAPVLLIGRQGGWQRFVVPAGAASLLLALAGFGMWRQADALLQPAGVVLRVVQLDLPQSERRYDARAAMLETYLELSSQPGLEQVNAVIWPEGALPALVLRDPELLAAMTARLPVGTRLLFGTPRAEIAEQTRYYNALAALTFTSEGPRLDAVYDKARLVPFGEGNPLRWLTAPFGFESLSTNSPFFSAGDGPQTLAVPGLPSFVPVICYEVIYPGYLRAARPRGAWILNISNDSWFGHASGTLQHFNQARYRAIETGLPLVRSASAGLSGLVTPLGQSLALTDPTISQALDIALPVPLDEPFYARYGDVPWVIVLLGLLFWVKWRLHVRRRRRLGSAKEIA